MYSKCNTGSIIFFQFFVCQLLFFITFNGNQCRIISQHTQNCSLLIILVTSRNNFKVAPLSVGKFTIFKKKILISRKKVVKMSLYGYNQEHSIIDYLAFLIFRPWLSLKLKNAKFCSSGGRISNQRHIFRLKNPFLRFRSQKLRKSPKSSQILRYFSIFVKGNFLNQFFVKYYKYITF